MAQTKNADRWARARLALGAPDAVVILLMALDTSLRSTFVSGIECSPPKYFLFVKYIVVIFNDNARTSSFFRSRYSATALLKVRDVAARSARLSSAGLTPNTALASNSPARFRA